MLWKTIYQTKTSIYKQSYRITTNGSICNVQSRPAGYYSWKTIARLSIEELKKELQIFIDTNAMM